MRILLLTLVSALVSTAQAQEAASPPLAFEVASVKLTQHGRTADGSSHSSLGVPSPGRFVATNGSLEQLILMAYGVKKYQLSGPDWLNSDAACYDIEAKASPDTTEKQIPLMIRTLLTERFKLALHRESKTLPVYALVAARNGPKLHEASPDAKGGFSSQGSRERVKLNSAKATMAALAVRLSQELDRPVLDKTAIKGSFQIALAWAREGDGPSIFSVIQEELGLKLEPAKAPIELLVIDHVEKIPTEN